MNIVASNNIIPSSSFHNPIPYEMPESSLALLNLLMLDAPGQNPRSNREQYIVYQHLSFELKMR